MLISCNGFLQDILTQTANFRWFYNSDMSDSILVFVSSYWSLGYILGQAF